MSSLFDLESWLRQRCAEYVYELRGAFVRSNAPQLWPVTIGNEDELENLLVARGQILPLPKESAALANILEVSIIDFLLREISKLGGLLPTRGSERGYPDLEITGERVHGQFHAVDVKVARRKRIKSGVSKNTDSRVTLYTGNTYFRYPKLHWPGTPRPFADYADHLDVICIYTLNEDSPWRVEDVELIVQPAWRIGSRQRSSTTREYIGAVVDIDDLRDGRGEFASKEEFYHYWRNYPFRIGRAVQRQLDKLLE